MSDEKISEILGDAPDNWGRWGDDDEIGAINFLDPDQAIRAAQAVETGESFTLGTRIFDPAGEFNVPTRMDPQHHMARDKGHYEAGKVGPEQSIESLHESQRTETALKAYRSPAGVETSDDSVYMYLHTSTHIDALGHCWYDDALYNGIDAGTTKGGLAHGSIEPIAQHGIVGRGILFDIPRYRGVDSLDPGDQISLDELLACADQQGVDIENRDIVLIRTGWIERYEEGGPDAIDYYDEPGMTATDEMISWFHDREVPMLGSDTIRSEQTVSDETGTFLPLHAAFLRDLGIPISELLELGDLADDCADDGKYDFMFVSGPLKFRGGTGSPVNPIAIK